MNKVKYFRLQKKLTQKELAERSGACSKGYICDVEKCNLVPNVYIAIEICRALGKKVEQVFSSSTDIKER